MMGVIATVSSSRTAAGNSQSSEDADEETWARLGLAPLMATLLLPIIIGVIVLIKCVFNTCCARSRHTTKEEMYGLEGRMTMLPNADASFVTITSHQPHERSSSPLTPTASLLETSSPKTLDNTFDNLTSAKVLINNNNANAPPNGDFYSSGTATLEPSQLYQHLSADSDLTDTLKRATGKRQLPDLPQIPQQALGHPPRRSSSVLSHDGTSELYATVGELPNATSRTGIANPYAHLMNRQSLTNDTSVSKPSTSRGVNDDDRGLRQTKVSIEPTPSSDSETYATSNHPYAKLKRNPTEHPYARVRNASLGNDDETDTDNYDLPQPYAQTRGRPGNLPSATNNLPGGSNQPSGSSNSINVIANLDGPVPPRRIGRQWRRGSNSQGQNADAASHFSGDSQDSRGYTSISVREPLSNIRSQIASTRNADSHYATVSDDSEEMYAAIDDSSESNYMQIPEGERPSRPSWLDAANVASPIPERREANSPLPPVPAVPPPETPGASTSIIAPGIAPVPTSPSLASQPQVTPPLYAQVTKKSKKGKAPVTPTASNASTSSQIGREIDLPSVESSLPGPQSMSSSSATHHSNSHHHHHRSKSRTLMDNSNPLEASIAEPRRWSKADISYSEFDIVREGLPPSESKSPLAMSNSIEWPERTISPRESITSKKSITEEFVDEDNYNVIPDKHSDGRISRNSKRSSGGSKSKSRRDMVDSDNYQEIEPISNTYQEIAGGKEPSDHYQEIGAASHELLNGEAEDQGPNALYQVIRKKDDEDYEEDEEDQFYEKVKPTSKATLSVPGHYLSLERKHGYEKLKRKGTTLSSPKEKSATSDDDDDDEEEENKGDDDNDAMYESVKYPPYERLKESRSDLAVDTVVDDEEENDLYEHIGYSRVKPKHKRSEKGENKKPDKQSEEVDLSSSADPGDVDINQLYAVVDKTKKKNKNTSKSSSSNINSSNTSNTHNNNNNLVMETGSNLSAVGGSLTAGSGSERDSTRSTTSTIKSGSSGGSRSSRNAGDGRSTAKTTVKKQDLSSLNIGAGADLDYIDDSIDIEYI